MYKNLETYAANGFALFPCSSIDKSPLTKHGFKDASTDVTQLIKWYENYPNCAWGAATSSARGVIDFDPRNDGDKSLARLIAKHGEMPLTPSAYTGGGGIHYWGSFPPGTKSATNFLPGYPGIDRKADGGYVIVPPSRIWGDPKHFRPYSWDVPFWEEPFAVCPAWLLNAKESVIAAREPQDDPWLMRASGDDLSTHPGCPWGEQTDTLCHLLGIHFARGDSPKTIEELAASWAERCNPPFIGWKKHYEGIRRKEEEKTLTTHTPPPLSVKITEDCSDNLLVPMPGKERKEGNNSDDIERQDDLVISFLPSKEGKNSDNGNVVRPAELFPSFPSVSTPSENDEGEGREVLSKVIPTLRQEAYHGLLGEILNSVEPCTESDPVTVLLGLLCCFGSCVGRGAWYMLDSDKHHPALFIGVVGLTSDRKGTGFSVARKIFESIDPVWAKLSVCNGIGSGQGLIERVSDESKLLTMNKKTGIVEEQIIPGGEDKRCLLRLEELALCFTLQRTESSTLGPTLLAAWGGDKLDIPNRKTNLISASNYSISILGDTQPGTIRNLVDKGIEKYNGWMNRFLWAAVQSTKDLGLDAKLYNLNHYMTRLTDALSFAKQAGQASVDDEAKALYQSRYSGLKRSGNSIPHTERAAQYVIRLALIYALVDCSKVIRLEHMRAALAVWDYCCASAKLIFVGAKEEPVPDPLWLRILNSIGATPGISRSDLLRAFRLTSADEMESTLKSLEAAGNAYRLKKQTEGRPAEHWFSGKQSEKESDSVDNPTLLPPDETSVAESVGKEGIKSVAESVADEGVTSFLPDKTPDDEKDVESLLTPGEDLSKDAGVRGEEGCHLKPGESDDDDDFLRKLELACA